MKFGNLSYLFLLWIAPALVFFYMYVFLRRERIMQLFCGDASPERLIASGRQKGNQRLKAVLVTAAVVLLIFALTRPRWGFHWEDIKRTGVDIIIAVDVSQSMRATDVEPSRLERAKREIYDLCSMLEGDRIGLIVFAGSAFTQCPLTLDYGAFRMFLDYVSPELVPSPGTALGPAIRKAAESFARHERKSKALILITDGEDHGSGPLEAAKEAKREGVKIFTIGIGKPEGAPIPIGDGGGFLKDKQGNVVLSRLDEKTLQKIALETGGSYVRSVTGDMDLEKIYRSQIQGALEKKELRSTRTKRWEERFQWFVFGALALLLIECFLRERR